MTTMFSPPRREKARDDHLPKGDCRYILMHPEVKGMRCACVGFALNRSIPGSTCECGHQACYHVPEKEPSPVERQELDALKEKVSVLEQELNRERQGGKGMIDRLGQLEELVDKTNAENESAVKNLHRGIGGLWHHVGLLNKRTPYYDDHVEGLVDDVQRIRNRLEEVDDAAMRVEDRVDVIETSLDLSIDSFARRRKASTPPSEQAAPIPSPIHQNANHTTLPLSHRSTFRPTSTSSQPHSHIQSFRARVSSIGSGSPSWTVHVSLLPTPSQPFPFEKDTAAYKRCLSRGLHRVIVIPGTDSSSFKTSVDSAFGEILRGRAWRPLVSRLCDAENLRGLPMLRQLPDWLLSDNMDFDVAFLQKYCAVVDEVGKILDLYIAMLDDTISWVEIKEVSVFLPGLEDAWEWDQFLDGPLRDDEAGAAAVGSEGGPGTVSEKRPAAGDIVPTWSASAAAASTSLKRGATEISRSGSLKEGEGMGMERERERERSRRVCTGGVELVGRRAEAV